MPKHAVFPYALFTKFADEPTLKKLCLFFDKIYVNENSRGRLNTSELCAQSGAAMTTALRWLDFLEERALINRFDSTVDQRIVYVELSHKGRTTIDEYFLQMRDPAIFGPAAKG